jgi:hypothetical protein
MGAGYAGVHQTNVGCGELVPMLREVKSVDWRRVIYDTLKL